MAKQMARIAVGRDHHAHAGFLLVEATLTAAVIAVGLVMVTRAVASSLSGVGRLEAIGQLMPMAQSQLDRLEADAQQAPLTSLQGNLPDPSSAYRWKLEPSAFEVDTITKGAMCAMTLTIERPQGPPNYRLKTVWPSTWLANGC